MENYQQRKEELKELVKKGQIDEAEAAATLASEKRDSRPKRQTPTRIQSELILESLILDVMKKTNCFSQKNEKHNEGVVDRVLDFMSSRRKLNLIMRDWVYDKPVGIEQLEYLVKCADFYERNNCEPSYHDLEERDRAMSESFLFRQKGGHK